MSLKPAAGRSMPLSFRLLLLLGALLQSPENVEAGQDDDLATVLRSRERAARLEAVFALSVRGDRAARRLLASVAHDPDAAVGTAAVRGLVHLGDAAGLEVALAWVREGSTADRLAALELLRLAPSFEEPVRRSVERALVDPDPQTRLAALELLEQRGVGPSWTALAELLDDATPAVRARAARALGAGGRGARHGVEVTLLLLPRLEDSDRHVVREAIHAFVALGRPEAGPALLRFLEEGPVELCEEVPAALAEIGFTAAVETLRAYAGQRSTGPVASHALRALGRIDSAEARAALLDLLNAQATTPDLEEALTDAAPRLAPQLIERLRDPVAAETAAGALARRGVREAIPALLALLRRGGGMTQPAIEALGALRATEAVVDLVLLARDRSINVRRAALEALADIGDPRAAVAIPPALRDPSARIRASAIALAMSLRASSSLGVLRERLRDESPGVRDLAAEALASMGSIPGPSGRLVLQVRSPDGAPRAGVAIVPFARAGTLAAAPTGTDGRVAVEVSATGQLAVTARDRYGELRLERARHGLGQISRDESLRP